MISIKELRKITQGEKVEGRERPWLYRSLQRGPSIYITFILLKTRLSPNQISFLSILAGMTGFFIFLSSGYSALIFGIIFFYLNILLDKVDGEVARYKKIFSLKGIFLDNINHLLIPSLFFFGLSLHIGLYRGLTLLTLVAGFLSVLSMSLIRTGWSLPAQIYAKKYLKHPELFILPETSTTPVEEAKKKHSFISLILRVVHQFQEFFMILLVFLIGIIAEIMTEMIVLEYLFVAFGILLPLIFLENSVKGYLSIEYRIRNQKDRFGPISRH
ncbi:hypothetical protein COV42_02950 [Candidatus Campbellbacteria bacterium CG11_big_fil_rev_8_21_14_0_20_44_21]|uniref:CDP-alcohol phosphatidyltransferase n=1 Tax=Candidatus Campbellbacteria bacterium CG22_combo_CG10-13_8_21_14_all_43_18 TaxID=1974530 RepID=A0A2H0DXI8_9BACT|nr:MAG: hypothetical protein COW82_02115 [Candidatus Campbellbacteria bacterium CG22_combo_CG10-13_8_21_14_all_43_18]PIR24007.1 MAG: hypothetical protein COV42_02950 [Candidatus Campbellbacteria bacterium CG11_big_fil_rev_8_21_14_0_20_44_21]